MNKGDFVGGIQVRLIATGQVMILGGTPDDWTGTWTQNGISKVEHFAPEQLDKVTPGMGG